VPVLQKPIERDVLKSIFGRGDVAQDQHEAPAQYRSLAS
jgi:hypothetical protein